MAEACPYDYGPGVYLARTMLSVADTNLYSFINDCEKGPQPSSQRLAQPEDDETLSDNEDPYRFNLYPNPNIGSFVVDLTMEETDVSVLQIWSITGQKILSRSLQAGQNQLDLRVSDGLYLYRIEVNRDPKWSGKISILRGY